MHMASSYHFLADTVLVLHFGVAVFVIAGLPLLVIGNLRGWRWVNGWRFRLAHLAAITVIAVQAWLGQECPLTSLETWLRVQAGSSGYAAGFVEHWVQRLLYHEAPPWVFTLAYTVFGGLVLAAWRRYPPAAPRWRKR